MRILNWCSTLRIPPPTTLRDETRKQCRIAVHFPDQGVNSMYWAWTLQGKFLVKAVICSLDFYPFLTLA